MSRICNIRRGRLLQNAVAALGYRVLGGVRQGEDAASEPEESLMVLGISRDKAVALGPKVRRPVQT